MAEEEKEKKPESESKEKATKPEPEAVAKKEEPAKQAEPAKEEAKVEEKKPEEKTETAESAKKEEKVEEKVEEKKEEKAEEPKDAAKPAPEAASEAPTGDKNTSEDAKTEDGDAIEEKPEKKKGFRLPFFGKKKEKDEEKKSDDSKENSSEDKETAPVKNEDEALAAIEKVEEELVEKITEDVDFASDVLVLKISKSRLMLVLGALVLLMWMLPAAKGAQMLSEKMGFKFGKSEEKTEVAPSEDVVKIKVRHNPDQVELSDELTKLLRDGGYDFIEIEEEETTVFEGVAVVTKTTDVETRIKIESLLTQKYKIASPSAELTDDSEFDAVVIMGKQSDSK